MRHALYLTSEQIETIKSQLNRITPMEVSESIQKTIQLHKNGKQDMTISTNTNLMVMASQALHNLPDEAIMSMMVCYTADKIEAGEWTIQQNGVYKTNEIFQLLTHE
jgi:hypothetical protein